MPYYRPVDPINGRISTFTAHTRRTTPSREPGVDYYVPIGTPVYAGVEGRVVEIGGGTSPATGRFCTINVTDGRRLRDLHLLEWRGKINQLVEPDTIIGLSGASGYGSEFFGFGSVAAIPASYGGPHVHRTLWPTTWQRFGYDANGKPYTLDYEAFVDRSAPAGGASTPFGDDMLADEREWLKTIYHTLTGGQSGVKEQGEIHRMLMTARDKASNADGHAKVARDAIVGLVADFAPGEAGVREAGRLLLLLLAADNASTPVEAEIGELDVDGLAAAIAEKLGLSIDDVRGAVRAELGRLSLSLS